MIAATRRGVLAGALAVPALAGVPRLAWARGENSLAVYDPALASGRHLAEAHGGEAVAIEGDRIRFARALFARRPSLVVGLSRPADALLIEDVAREAGYRPVPEGADAMREMIAASRRLDRGLVLGWMVAPGGVRRG